MQVVYWPKITVAPQPSLQRHRDLSCALDLHRLQHLRGIASALSVKVQFQFEPMLSQVNTQRIVLLLDGPNLLAIGRFIIFSTFWCITMGSIFAFGSYTKQLY